MEYLKKTLPKLPNKRSEVWEAFLDAVKPLGDVAGLEAITFNNTDPLIWFSDLGSSNGAFDDTVPTRVEISKTIAEHFERDHQQLNAQILLESKVLHEMVHWALNTQKIAEIGEPGEQFEIEAYGKLIPRYWLTGSVPAQLFDVNVADRMAHLLSGVDVLSVRNVPEKDDDRGPFTSRHVTQDMKRGIRNNNPGNIKRGDAWRGLAQPSEMRNFQVSERVFCVFKEPEWGIRAIAKILSRYQSEYGLKTPEAMIARWAPQSDNNDVGAYAKFVANSMDIETNDAFEFSKEEKAMKMIGAMIRMENGKQPYLEVQIETALSLSAT
jgi:hypothetical protein